MAEILSTLRQWSATASSNPPAGTVIIGTGLDDNLREIQAVVRKFLASVATPIASATTVDLSAADGYYINITDTNPISAFGTEAAGIQYLLRFSDVLTLTHNATSLILPGGLNITTANGDMVLMISEGSGNWRCISYQKIDVFAPVILTSTSNSVAVDASKGNNFELLLTENTTLANPTNLKAGMHLFFHFTNGSAATYTLAFDTKYKFSTLDTHTIPANLDAVAIMSCYCKTGTARLDCVFNPGGSGFA